MWSHSQVHVQRRGVLDLFPTMCRKHVLGFSRIGSDLFRFSSVDQQGGETQGCFSPLVFAGRKQKQRHFQPYCLLCADARVILSDLYLAREGIASFAVR